MENTSNILDNVIDTEIKTINMCCCCVSRDIFGFKHEDKGWNIDINKNQNEKICQYINFSSPIISNQPVNKRLLSLDMNKIKEEYAKTVNNLSNFRFRCSMIDISHSLFNFLSMKKTDFLILDNGWARYNYLLLEDESIITDGNRELINYLIKYKYIPPIKKTINFDDIPESKLEEFIAIFLQNILKYYKEEQIILIEVRPSKLYIASNSLNTFFSKNNEDYKLDLTFRLMNKYLKNAYTITAPDILIADASHVWGLHPLHFVKEVYTHYYYPCIKEIIYNSVDKNNEIFNKIHENFKTIEYNNYFHLFYDLAIHQPIEKKIDFIKTVHNTYLYIDLIKLKMVNITKTTASHLRQIHLQINNDTASLTFQIENETYFIKIADSSFNLLFIKDKYTYPIEFNSDSTLSIKTKYGYISAQKNNLCALQPKNQRWEHYFI